MWTQQLTPIEVKSHSGCQLNEMADELADLGCASEEEPICPGPQINGSLLLRIRPSKRQQIESEGTGHRLPRDGACQSNYFAVVSKLWQRDGIAAIETES
jgi:hypothetical protein